MSIICMSPDDTAKNFTYSWHSDGLHIQPGRSDKIVEDLFPTGTRLYVPKVKKSENYSCTVDNRAGVFSLTSYVFMQKGKYKEKEIWYLFWRTWCKTVNCVHVPSLDITFQSHMSWSCFRSLIYDERWLLVCWYWWCWWPSLFKLPLHNTNISKGDCNFRASTSLFNIFAINIKVKHTLVIGSYLLQIKKYYITLHRYIWG